MKKIIWALSCAMLFWGVQAAAAIGFQPSAADEGTDWDKRQETVVKIQNEKPVRKITAGAASNVSDKPGQEGAKKLCRFYMSEDTEAVVDHTSPHEVRKAVVKMGYKLWKEGCISYAEYESLAHDLDIRARKRRF